MKRLGIILTLLLLTGCNFFAPQEGAVSLLQEENEAYTTEIAAIRATATFTSDRLMATLSFAQTAVRNVDFQSTRIASTLIANGAPGVDTSGIMPTTPTPRPDTAAQPAVAPASANSQFVTPIVIGEGSARGSISLDSTPPPQETPLAPAPTPLPQVQTDSTAPSLTDITVSRSVGADDCPTGASTEYTTADTSIYITAVGNNLTSANTLFSRWLLNGSEIVVYDWTPPGNINGACIWFYITPEGVDFTPGNWTVELSIDNTPAGTATFTISGDTMTEGEG